MAKQKENTKSKTTGDLGDSPEDVKRLEPDKADLELPDVKDIPGQEHVHVPRMGELADTTISSDDEEGKTVFKDNIDENANVTEEEIESLRQTSVSMSSRDDLALRRSKLDDKDLDGEALNEKEGISGDDLDVPGSELDDPDEAIGEEDEENNEYSLGGDNHD